MKTYLQFGHWSSQTIHRHNKDINNKQGDTSLYEEIQIGTRVEISSRQNEDRLWGIITAPKTQIYIFSTTV